MSIVRKRIFLLDALAAALLTIVSGSAGWAQTVPTDLNVELNKLEQTGGGCQITFVASNQFETSISKLALEMAFFNEDGLLEKLSKLDFQDLPKGKSKVRQFAIADLQCAQVSRILINDVTTCETSSEVQCASKLKTQNRSKIEFGT